jgi:serine/threonine-protein kinase
MGSYHLREKLGEGGMGEVWIADHEMLARPAAIKLIRHAGDATHTVTDEMLHRFEREVQAAAHLRSPHTIEIYDYGLADDGTFFYVMELLDGLDLDAFVKEYGPQPWPRVVAILTQVCHSLGEAHERGLVHRDIKPANIFLCRVGRDVDQVKVLDFGLVKMTADAGVNRDLTQEGMFVGTPAFAPPEQAKEGVEAIDARGDIYSLGCVAFWLLTGRLVFERKTPVDMLIAHARDEPLSPARATELEIPAALDALVLGCLAKDAHDRPSSADDLVASLETLQADWTEHDARAWWSQHRRAAVS